MYVIVCLLCRFLQDVTFKASEVTLNAGAGSLEVGANRQLDTSNQPLIITADDMDLLGTMTSGNGPTTISCYSDGRTVGIGSSKSFYIESGELQRMTTNGLWLEGSRCAYVEVKKIQSQHTVNILGIFTISATRDEGYVDFKLTGTSVASTFSEIAVQADAGIHFGISLTANAGSLYLDGDAENSATSDTTAEFENKIKFENEVTMSASELLTLEVTTGSVEASGTLTLRAGLGIIIQDSIAQSVPGSDLVFDSDYELFGDGTFTLTANKVVTSSNSDIHITAWDVDLQEGSGVLSGTGGLTLHGSQSGQTIRLGDNSTNTTHSMHLDNAELGRIVANGGTTVGSSTLGTITLDGILDSASDSLDRLVLKATLSESQVVFVGGDSSFNKGITILANDGIAMGSSVTTKNSATYISAGSNGVTIADTHSLSSSNQQVELTADDIDLQGTATLSAGTATLQVLTTTAAHTVGLGNTTRGMQITDTELGLFTATGDDCYVFCCPRLFFDSVLIPSRNSILRLACCRWIDSW